MSIRQSHTTVNFAKFKPKVHPQGSHLEVDDSSEEDKLSNHSQQNLTNLIKAEQVSLTDKLHEIKEHQKL